MVSNKCSHFLKVIAFHNPHIGKEKWSISHAQMPTPYLNDEGVGVFFTTRDLSRLSRISFVQLDHSTKKILPQSRDLPILDIGTKGSFDSKGVMSSSLLELDGKKYLFYIGWNAHEIYPYDLNVGMAISTNDLNFTRSSTEKPILSSDCSKYRFITTPFVSQLEKGFKMLFSAGGEWVMHDNRWESTYSIASVESTDLFQWSKPNVSEYSVTCEGKSQARPTLANISGQKHLIYSERDNFNFRVGQGGYKIRMKRIQSNENWNDCEVFFEENELFNRYLKYMQCYPFPIEIAGKLFLFLNGNEFGKFGFAVAEVLN